MEMFEVYGNNVEVKGNNCVNDHDDPWVEQSMEVDDDEEDLEYDWENDVQDMRVEG